jgi:serine/threonine-protein kinase RsbW
MTVQLDVTIPGHASSISPVVDRVLELARDMGCAQGKEFEIETALREALANAVRHGTKNDPGQLIECSVSCDTERGVLIVIRDPGEGFDPASLPSPIQGQNVYSDHGRGIYLINQLMDEVSFGRNGTEISMRKAPKP